MKYEKKFFSKNGTLPEFCGLQSEILLSSDTLCVFPHFFLEYVGYEDDKGERHSFFKQDVYKKTTDILDKLKAGGFLRENEVYEHVHSSGGRVVKKAFYVEYIPEDAPEKKQTAANNITLFSDMKVSGNIEILFRTDDGVAERYLIIPFSFERPQMSFFEMCKGLSMYVENYFFADHYGETPIEDFNREKGLLWTAQDEFEILFFSTVDGKQLYVPFQSMKELMSTVISVRLTDVKSDPI